MTNEEIQVCLQPSQSKYIKVEILNQTDNVIDELQGIAIDGSCNIDSTSAVRRTCDIKFILSTKLLITSSSPIWINKRFRLFTGILSLRTNEIVWFKQGIFIINDPSVDILINEKTISIKGLDKMCYYTNDVSGQLNTKTVININTPIPSAIQSTITLLGKETKYLIDNNNLVVPYKIESEPASTIYDLLKILNELYMDWKIYYDVDGYFIYKKIKTHINDPIIFDFSIYKGIVQSINNVIKYSNIKNYYKVIGKLQDNGTQPFAELTVTDSLYPNNLFTVEKMKESILRSFILSEDKYFTKEQCQSRLEYEFYNHNHFAEEITLTCIPLPFLDVEQVIYLNYPDYNIEGKYCIKSISSGLVYNATMSINAYKIYN
jgi:hypothetical protein